MPSEIENIPTPPVPALPATEIVTLDYASIIRESPEVVGPLAHGTASGFGWMLAQTLSTKSFNMVGNVVLAWLLLREQFAVVALALGIVTFANLIQEAGLNQILVHRGAKLDYWANAAFWMSIATGLLGGIVMALAAPIAARIWDSPQLTGLILILAVRSPIVALGTVPNAKLQIDLRFRTLALVGSAMVMIQVPLAIGFALVLPKNEGAYAFILPLLIVAVIRVVVLWRVAPVKVRATLQLDQWRFLVNDSVVLLLMGFFFTVTSQGDYLIVGRMHQEIVLGIYYFAYNLTLQTTQFLTTNLTGVLFPTLSKLQNDPDRQRRAFLRAANMLMLLAVPICLLQAAVAGPMVHVLFQPKWYPAIPVLQVISVAMSLQLVNMPAKGMIQAQGRFRTLLVLSILCAVTFVGLIYAASLTGYQKPGDGSLISPAFGHFLAEVFGMPVNVSTVVALSVLVYCVIVSPTCLFASIHPVGGSWRDIWPIYLIPFGLSIPAIGLGLLAGHWIPAMRGQDWVRLIVISLISGLVYLPLVRLAAPSAWKDLIDRVRGLIKR